MVGSGMLHLQSHPDRPPLAGTKADGPKAISGALKASRARTYGSRDRPRQPGMPAATCSEDSYSEWRMSSSLKLVPSGAGHGLSMSLTPSYGADPGGSERLRTMPDASRLAANDDVYLSIQLYVEVAMASRCWAAPSRGRPKSDSGC